MKIVSIIPARGGSKGIPRKNLKQIAGKPLLHYVISASLGSNVSETWVSSDDAEILNFSASLGAKTLVRPKEISGDFASSEAALEHFCEHVDFDCMIFLQATSPLTIAQDINKAIEMLSEYDSVVAVTENHQLAWIRNQPQYNLHNRKRRQDSEQTFLETGAMFACYKQNFLQTNCRLHGDIGLLKVPKIRSFDIDTHQDIAVVEAILKA